MGDADDTGLDFKDVAAIVRGALNFGRLRLHKKAMMFKSQKTGKIDQYSGSDISTIYWMRASRGYQITVCTDNNTAMKFVGFEEKSKDAIKKFVKSNYDAAFTEKEPFVKGWNWGKANFIDSMMSFENDSKPLFDIALSDVSAATVNKNEVTLEFHQDEDNDLNLVEMRFYVPPLSTVLTDGDHDEENDVVEGPADVFHRSVMKYADVIQATGDTIVKFKQVLLQTPRGRYDMDMYPSFLRLHGKSYDYKIPYSTVIRLFLLPHNDQRSVYFVITLDPPIRQGQTRYPHIVIQFIKEDWSDLTLEVDEETLAGKYEGKLQKEMAGPTYEIFSKVMKSVAGQKIYLPGTFSTMRGSQGVACSYKANNGYLYPLEKGFMFVVKPPVHIRFDEVSAVNFSRVASGVGQSRSFDLEIETKSGVSFIFASIEKQEYSKLFDFLKSKKIKIQNTKGGDTTFHDDFGDGSGSDEEMPDHYLEKMKAEGQERDSEDSDESEDLDFVAGETPPTSPPTSADEGEGGNDADGKKKHKKPVKETEIRTSSEKKPRSDKKEKKAAAEPKGRGGKAKKDPNKPKKPPTGFFLWLADNRQKIKDENEGITVTEIAKKAGEIWRGLEESDRQDYVAKSNGMKAGYEERMKEYNQSLKDNPVEDSPSPVKKKKAAPSKPAPSKPAQPKTSGKAYTSKAEIGTDDDLSDSTDDDKPKPDKTEVKTKKEVTPSPVKNDVVSGDSSADESDKESSNKRKREQKEKKLTKKPEKKKEKAQSSKKRADTSDEDDEDVVVEAESSGSASPSPPPKRSMRGGPVGKVHELPDDSDIEADYTDGEPPDSPDSDSD